MGEGCCDTGAESDVYECLVVWCRRVRRKTLSQREHTNDVDNSANEQTLHPDIRRSTAHNSDILRQTHPLLSLIHI